MNKRVLYVFLVMVILLSCIMPTNATEISSESNGFEATETVHDSTESVAMPFTDVPVNAWYYPYANKASELGIMQGSGGRFSPDANMTFAQIITIAARIHSQINGTTIDEIDESSHWAEKYWYYCIGQGIIDTASLLQIILNGGPDVEMSRVRTAELLYSSVRGSTLLSEDISRLEKAAALNKTYEEGKTNAAVFGSYFIKDPEDIPDAIYGFYSMEKDALANTLRAGYSEIFHVQLPDIDKIDVYSLFPVLSLYSEGIIVGSDAAGTFGPETNVTRAQMATFVSRIFDKNLRIQKRTE